MKRNLNLIVFLQCLWLFLSNNQVTEGSDINCEVDCACCKEKKCAKGEWFSNECTLGCIDGFRGARCYEKCKHNCKQCPVSLNTCTECYDGYYPGSDRDCTSRCLLGCKTCTSHNSCTSCKEEYYNDNGSNDCPYRKCPGNCKCENDQCVSCMEGYYDTSNSCNSSCPANCVTCSSSNNCESCKNGFYNWYQNDDSRSTLLNDCTNKCRDNCVNCSSYDDCSVCKTGLYGSTCDKSCSAGCVTKFCDMHTGSCDCYPNFAGDKCDRCIVDTIVGKNCDACLTGLYGLYCNLSCSLGCKSKQCNRTDGECIDGCLSNFIGKHCNECIIGKYGDQCNIDCPSNCDEKKCLKDSGNCIQCSVNFAGDKCEKCESGLYGTTCSENCPNKCANITCDRGSGMCLHGCIDNYSGDRCCVNNNNCETCSSDTRCKRCKTGFFNDQCEKPCSQNCRDTCNIETGICDNCKSNYYGEHCNSSCASTCKYQTTASGSICQRDNGDCQNGCIKGFYGFQCSKNCSSYCIDTTCDKGDGKCTKESRQNGDGGEENGNLIGAVVGLLAAVALVLTIVAIVVYKRRQSGQNKGEKSDLEETQPSRTSRNNEQTHTFGNIAAVEISGSKTMADKEGKPASIPAPLVTSHNEKAIRQSSVVSPTLDVNDVRIAEAKENSQTDYQYYNITESPYRIKVDNLLNYVTSKNVDFEAEFKKLNKDLDLTKYCRVAKQPENIALNRYNGIYPYDHSRVIIPAIPDFYINACYIDGYCKEKEYIASLGPTSKTTANFFLFWLMVWYERSDIIVMVTNLRETSGMKCEQYWPEAETENLYGEITVKCRSIEEFAEYSVRTYTILKNKERRQVIQLHYTAWPDKGVPQEVTSLVEFRQRVNVVPKTLGGPIIVHCSAGVGRTGTYIALDTLTREGKEKGSVDVFACVNKMRYQRVNMVQTAEQYKFLHKALVHSLSFGCETMTAEEIQKIMYDADSKTFSNIFKSLAQEVDIESKDELTAREENKKRYKDKNRQQSGIPGNNSRVRLFLARKVGQHDYINAVFINSFRIKHLFIASQTPLPGTIEDFLSMIFQQNTACVVALEDQNNPSKDIGQYLPADNETYPFGNFSVTSSKNETKSQYILKNLTVKDHAKDQTKSVNYFQYKTWRTSKKVPDSATEFVQFVKDVEEYVSKDPEDHPNIIAHCLNGFERTGLFCIVYKLLEKLEAERQVSVVNTIRKIRTHRRQSVTSVEQLKFCFECISAYLEAYNTYTNFAS